MNCSEAQRIVYDYLNGELEELDHSRVESHLKVCPPCCRMFELERRFQELVIQQGPRETAPPHLRAAILDRIDQLQQPRSTFATVKKRPLFRPTLVLAPIGLVVVFLAIVFLATRANKQDPIEVLIQNHIRAGTSQEVLALLSSDPKVISSGLERELGLRTSLGGFLAAGATLKGGSVIPVCDCKVGLVYFSIEGVGISLFICHRGKLPCPAMETISRRGQLYRFTTVRGLNLLVWEDADLDCIAVSRLSKETLLDFASPRT